VGAGLLEEGGANPNPADPDAVGIKAELTAAAARAATRRRIASILSAPVGLPAILSDLPKGTGNPASDASLAAGVGSPEDSGTIPCPNGRPVDGAI